MIENASEEILSLLVAAGGDLNIRDRVRFKLLHYHFPALIFSNDRIKGRKNSNTLRRRT